MINLSFFGGGGSSKETVKTHSEKSDYLKNMDSAMYQFFQPIVNKYGGLTLSDIGSGTSGSTSGTGSASTLYDPANGGWQNTSGTNSASTGSTSNTSSSATNGTTGVSWLDDPNNIMGQGFATADKTYSDAMSNANNLLSSSNSILNKQTGLTDEAAQAARETQEKQKADLTRASGYLDQYDSLYNQYKGNNYGQGYLDSANSSLLQAATAGNADYADAQSYYKQAADMAQNGTDFANAANYYAQAADIAQNGEDFAQAARANANLEKYMAEHGNDAATYTGQLADLTNNANTNTALQNYMTSIYDSINSNLNKSASNALAGAAARGIINSSTSNRAISNLTKGAQTTAAEQFATGFNNLSNNYNSLINAANNNLINAANAYKTEADSARALGDSRVAGLNSAAQSATNLGNNRISGLNSSAQMAQALGAQKVGDLQNQANAYNTLYNSYNSNTNSALSNLLSASGQAASNANIAAQSGNQIVSNLMSAASGYGDAYKNALAGVDANQTAASKAYTTALAPVMSAYQYWRDLNTDHTNQDTEDTIVTSGGK